VEDDKTNGLDDLQKIADDLAEPSTETSADTETAPQPVSPAEPASPEVFSSAPVEVHGSIADKKAPIKKSYIITALVLVALIAVGTVFALNWNHNRQEEIADVETNEEGIERFNSIDEKWAEASVLIDSGDKEAAIALMEQVLTDAEASGNQQRIFWAKWYLASGLQNIGDRERALPIFSSILNLSVADQLKIDALSAVVGIHLANGDIDEAERYVERSADFNGGEELDFLRYLVEESRVGDGTGEEESSDS
jgi:tetratricopeptide (TPR) repeat protein